MWNNPYYTPYPPNMFSPPQGSMDAIQQAKALAKWHRKEEARNRKLAEEQKKSEKKPDIKKEERKLAGVLATALILTAMSPFVGLVVGNIYLNAIASLATMSHRALQ